MTAVPPQIPFHIFRIFQVERLAAYFFSTKYQVSSCFLARSTNGPPTVCLQVLVLALPVCRTSPHAAWTVGPFTRARRYNCFVSIAQRGSLHCLQEFFCALADLARTPLRFGELPRVWPGCVRKPSTRMPLKPCRCASCSSLFQRR